MRITESRIRRIIREELLREVAGGGDVDERFASLTNFSSELSATMAAKVRPLVYHMRALVEDEEIADGELAVEGIVRFQRIKEIAGRMPGGKPFTSSHFWQNLDEDLRKLRLDRVRETVAAARRRRRDQSGYWDAKRLTNYWAAAQAFGALTVPATNPETYPEWDEGVMPSEIIEKSVSFAKAMRDLESDPNDLEILETLRDGSGTIAKFLGDPELEDYHEQIIDLVAGDPNDVLQAIELASNFV